MGVCQRMRGVWGCCPLFLDATGPRPSPTGQCLYFRSAAANLRMGSGDSPCVVNAGQRGRRAVGTVPEWAAGTVPVWSLPSPLRDRNVASPLLRNCGVWWAILYLTRRGRHVYGVVRSFYHRCFNRFQMSELEIDLEPFAVHFALTISKSDSSDIISCISFVFRHAGLAGSRDSPRMVPYGQCWATGTVPLW